jgi:hypothetical protein
MTPVNLVADHPRKKSFKTDSASTETIIAAFDWF